MDAGVTGPAGRSPEYVVRGVTAEIRYGYQRAARVEAYTMTIQKATGTGTIRARVVDAHPIYLGQAPLELVGPGIGRWALGAVTLEPGGVLRGDVARRGAA